MDDLLRLPWKPLYSQVSADDQKDSQTPLEHWALAATVLFTLVVFLFEGLLDERQKRAYKITTFPSELEKTVGTIDAETEKSGSSAASADDDKKKKDGEIDTHKPLLPQLKTKFVNAQAYGMDKVNFSIVSSIYGTFEGVAFLLLGFIPWAWDVSANWAESKFGWTETEHEIKISLVFLFLITIVGTITGLPFEIYSTFQIEKKHGFNKQTPKLFVTDKIKSLILSCLIGGPFVSLLLKIIKWGGEHFYVYVWAFTFCFSVFMMTIVPVFIMPLFN